MGKCVLTEQDVYKVFGVPQELMKDGSPNKESAEIQLNEFLKVISDKLDSK